MEKTINIQVEYRRRKSFELKWMDSHELRVLVPMGTTRKTIDELIRDKSDWMERSRQQMLERENQRKKDYLKASSILYAGEEISICWEKTSDPLNLEFRVKSKDFAFVGTGTPEEAQALVEEFIRGFALADFKIRAEKFALKLGVKINKVRVRSQKTRWGSCSSKGNLNFNWHAIVAPPEVIDYLVIHECCHLVHMNHSKEFWVLVESMCPNYRTYKTWLKNHDPQILP